MKRTAPVFLFAVLVLVFGFQVRSAEAFQGFDDGGGASVPACAACHLDLANDGPDHAAHAALSNNDCNSCHGGGGKNNPPLANCVRCHGRDADGNPSADFSAGLGRGLRQHHVTVGAAACGNCHGDTVNATTGSAPENVLPSFYPQALGGAGLDPCDGSEEQFPSRSVSLDNDGDGLTDGADPDCAAAGTPDITVTDSVAPDNDLQVPFGSVTVGASSDQTVTVMNDGTADLVIGTVASADALAAPFSILNDTCSGQTLAPTASCTLTARFSPTATGAANDTFDIPSNDPDENPVTVNVSGTGTAALVPDITVTDSVAPGDDLDVPFGSVSVGASSDQTVTVTNDGTADLVIGTVASADALAAPFSIPAGTDGCSGTTLAPLANCTVTVRFAPTALGAANDTFDIPSDDPDESPVTVSVNGTGAVAVPDITVTDSVAPANDLQVPFGNVVENTTSDQTVTVTNDGTLDLVIGTVALTDALAAPFSILNDTCSGQTLAPSANCTVTVRFAPTALGAANDTFDIPSDDPDENPVTVSVSGTGVTQSSSGGGGCSIGGFGSNGGGGAVLFLTLLAILVTLRRQGAKARR